MASALWFDTPPAAPGGVHTFSAEPDRRRLTGAAVKAVLRLVDAWGGSNAEGAALLGVSESTWDRMKAGRWDGVLSQDQLTRASALIGVFKGLHLLFADAMADRWPMLENRGPAIGHGVGERSEEHTSALQSLMRIPYALFCLNKIN